MKILITGIGCIGKSTLREKLATDFPEKIYSIDMDYEKEIPSDENKVVLVESVHGLEEDPQQYNKILYVLPPKHHTYLWLRRGWSWFSSGIVDISSPKGNNKRYSIVNIPIIIKLLLRNIILRKKWVKSDVLFIKNYFLDNTCIIKSIDDGYTIIKSWINELLSKREFIW